MKELNEEIKKPPNGLVSFVSSVVLTVFWGLAIGLIINGAYWAISGFKSVNQDLDRTANEQALSFDGNLGFFENRFLSTLAFVKSKESALLAKLKHSNATLSKEAAAWGPRAAIAINRALVVCFKTLEVLILKFLSIFASAWIYVFFAFMGAIDGLLSRYIRTEEGGRESTFLFHKISSLMLKLPLGILFFYLALPFFIDPQVVVLVVGVLFFSFFQISSANLKKFI